MPKTSGMNERTVFIFFHLTLTAESERTRVMVMEKKGLQGYQKAQMEMSDRQIDWNVR